MPMRPCLGWQDERCGKLGTTSRCSRHEGMRKTASYAAAVQRGNNARSRPHRDRRPDYDSAERSRRAETVRVHREVAGDWCPGWNRPAHQATDLTAEHPVEVAAGGAEGQEHVVLCRSCNSSKGGRIRRSQPPAHPRGGSHPP
jgi:5-methylcytosine-specific restriction protein A